MSKNLNKLSHNESYLIDIWFNQERKSISEIGRILNCSKSTISRELKRNTFDGYYNHEVAQQKTIRRRWHNHAMYLLKYKEYTDEFMKKFDKRYSGIKTTFYKLQIDTLKPTWRQIYNWIKSNRWKIKRKDILRKHMLKEEKGLKGFFLNLLILLYFRYEQVQNILIIIVNLVIEKWILSLAKKSMDMKI